MLQPESYQPPSLPPIGKAHAVTGGPKSVLSLWGHFVGLCPPNKASTLQNQIMKH